MGCSSSSSDSTTLPHPTIVEVSPREFSSPPACDEGEGSLRRYVATLVDVTPTVSGAPLDFRLPSSALQVEAAGSVHYEPIPCRLAVDFGWVVDGHRYRTELLGFDRTDLELLEPGLPIVIDAATRAIVPPRWKAQCGVDREPEGSEGGATSNPPLRAVQAEAELTRTVRFCESWVEVTAP